MGSIYPGRWHSTMGDSPQHPARNADGSAHPKAGQLTVAGDTWSRGLAGLTAEQIGHGLTACIARSDAWPPTLPEFRALCLGIPSLLQVREDIARKDSQRAPFTMLVLRHIDSWAFRHADQREAERLLREAYNDAREAVMRGEPLPEPAPEIEHKPEAPKPASPEVARAAMDAIRASLHIDGDSP